MGRRVAIYIAVALLLTGAGLAITFTLNDGDEKPEAPDVADVKVDQPTTPASDVQPLVDTDTGANAHEEQGTVEVLETSGTVTRSTGDGEWVEVTPGQQLSVDDAVKTEDKSRVTLKVGEESTIDLAERAEVKVREISSSVQRLGLVHGRASVDYKDGGQRVLRIENADGSAVAEVKEGKFSIMNTGETVAVATETGSVDLSASGENVVVAAGEQSMVSGGAPSRPLAIPMDLLLRVADPGCRVQRETYITLKGKTNPGSDVRVNETAAIVKKDGRFAVRIPLRVGKNKIVVVTSDVSGREKRRVFPCVTVDPGAAIKEIDINWGSSKKKENS